MKNLGLWSFAAIVAVFCVAMTIASPAQTFKVLVDFNYTVGATPSSPLVQGLDGNFYGTTGGGGANQDGTLFKITATGTLTTLHNFCSQSDCADGLFPSALVLGRRELLRDYRRGGANSFGTVFKITPQGVLTTLHSFCSQTGCPDSSFPVAPLVQASDGNFYGTTGGNAGTVFKMTPQGALITLHYFLKTGCPEGYEPAAGLVIGTDGKLYGTTVSGGASSACYEGCGTVFSITSAGTLTTLHSLTRLTVQLLSRR